MPDAYTPPGSANSYSVPADLDAVDVATWFEDFADTVDTAVALKLDVAPTQSVKTADATFALADATGGKSIVANKATAIVFTIPPQASVTWGANAELHWFNKNDGVLTIAPGAGVTFIGTTLTFAKGTGGKAVRTASNEWVVLPFSAGSAAPTVSGTTGSPTVTTPNGKTCYAFTASGSITAATAGTVRALIVGGGGSGAQGGNRGGGGGAGGEVVALTSLYLTAGAHTITVGAGGAAASESSDGNDGGYSCIGSVAAAGGGGGGYGADGTVGHRGGNGGGGGTFSGAGGAGGVPYTTGFAGGSAAGGAANRSGGGGGGAGAVGVASGANAGAGGAGEDSDITGSTVHYGAGGGGASYTGTQGAAGGTGASAGVNSGSSTAGTANTGSGTGGCAAAFPSTSGAASAGVVIILVG